MLMDGNGNLRTYRYHGTRTDVKAYGANGSLDFEWTQKIGDANVSAGIQDAQNAQSQLVYENTYRPIQYTNRNNQTFTMTRDIWGNPLTLTTPRGIQWQFTYNYPADYPVEPLISMTVTQQGSDGSVRTPTIYEFYQTTNISQGAVRGLVSRILSPRPGTVGTGEQVETRFYYTALGNVAMIDAPGANNDGRRWTTVFFYTVDPWGGGPFTERQNQPVAVAVYDKTLTLADYASIPSDPALRDDRLVFFERYRYDDRGNLIAIQDAAGFTTTLSYNRGNQLEEIVYPTDSLNGVQARERFLYRYIGGPLYAAEVYNATARVRFYSFGLGSEGEIRGTEVAGERKADIGYDSQYRLRSTQGGRNATTGQRHTTQYAYTAQNFPQQTRYPNGDTYTLTEHDNEGNPLRRLDAQGLITLYIRALSIDSRLEEVQYPDNTGNLRFEYDGFNRVRRLTRLVPDLNSAIVVEYSYDDNDLITSVRTTYPGLTPREVSYTYYPDGSRASMTVAGSLFTYEYTFITGTLRVSGEPFAGMRVRVNLPVPTGLRLDSWYDRRGLLRMEETTNGVYREYHYNGRGL
jgi:YD repeat-containing protein